MSNASASERETFIGPDGPWWKLDVAELWRYRDLVWLLVRRDITAVYKQTVLGPLWHVVQPLLTSFMFALIFGRAAGFAPKEIPGMLFYLSGLVPWFFFANVVNKTSKTFTANAALMGKVYFPRLAVPLSVAVSNLASFGIQFFAFLVLLIGYHVFDPAFTWSPSPALLLLPVLVVIMGLLGLGAGILISALTTKYRDLSFLVGFGVQLLMYASPVIFPLSRLQNFPMLLTLFNVNPMTSVIESMRAVFFGQPIPWGGLGYTCVFTLCILMLGTAVFNKVERSFADIV
ncbi:MAG: ABC transporter permease [Flavobacteriales bacterium]|nr:ABC transporter permease [Flavobacteriales bacterium]